MIRNLKALGFAFVAVAAMSALAASTAQAAPGELHSEVPAGKTTAILTGENIPGGNHTFTFSGGWQINCPSAKLEGTVAKATTDATVTPQYTFCRYTRTLAAEVKMNGCKYTWKGAADFTANLDIVGCTTGKSIEVIAGACLITVPEQTGLKHVVFSNKAGPPKHIEASVTLTGITYTGTAPCMGGSGHHGDGTLTGTTTVKAFEDEGLKELAEHYNHKYQPFKCGKQVGLFST